MKVLNVIVATDFSNEAYGALFYVTQLLSSKHCTFHIINSYDDLTSANKTQNIIFLGKKEVTRLRNTSLEQLSKTIHKIKLDNENPLHEFKSISMRGTLASILSQSIDDLQIDLVIMGSKGKTSVKEVFMGSNTLKVANTIHNCPILAIPKEIAYAPLSEIAFVTNFKRKWTLQTLAPLKLLASVANAQIIVLQISKGKILSQKQIFNKNTLAKYLLHIPHCFEEVMEYGDKANVIQNFLSERKIKMLAMAHHKRFFFERLFREPVIQDMSIYTKTPFLILPMPE